MKDLYLRFASVDQTKEQLTKFGFYLSEEQGGLYHPDISLDIIGVISYTKVDEETSEFVVKPGYHVNLRIRNDEIDLSDFDNFVVNPETPVRIWA